MGGFQVVNTWSDPQQYKCQKNFIIYITDGIGNDGLQAGQLIFNGQLQGDDFIMS